MDDDIEFVGTDPCDGLDLRQGHAQPFGGFDQHLVADAVPQGFVDRREVVEIDKQQRHDMAQFMAEIQIKQRDGLTANYGLE